MSARKKPSKKQTQEQSKAIAFIGALDRAIDFHRNNRNDPHNVGNAVIAALSEVRDAFKAYMV